MKRIFSVILTVVLVFSCAAICASAADTSVVSGTVPYSDMQFYYRDSYFDGPASAYNRSLASLSYIMSEAASAHTWYGWENQNIMAAALLQKMGFTGIESNDLNKQQPDTDTMGVTMAYKNVGAYTVLVIAPRSLNYGAEWASNFTLGASGEAQGFARAAAIVETFAESYVKAHTFTNTVKVWTMGYSRGAAVANLVAGHLTKAGALGGVKLQKDNIFGYTFEAPRCTNTSVVSVAEARTYTNIHNIITATDIVTKLAPKSWGFLRYGIDESVIPEAPNADNAAYYAKMLSYLPAEYKTTDGSGNTVTLIETYQGKKFNKDLTAIAKLGTWVKENGIYVWKVTDLQQARDTLIQNTGKSMSDVLDDLMDSLAKGVGSRASYTDTVQTPLRTFLAETTGYKYSGATVSAFYSALGQELKNNELSLLVAAATGRQSYLEDLLTAAFNNALEKAGMDTAAWEGFAGQLLDAVPLAANAVMADMLYHGGTDVLSFIENIDMITQPHYPAYTWAWLRTLDPNYTPDTDTLNARVTDVNVSIVKKTETKKVLFVKYTNTYYDVTITPVATNGSVKKVEYRTLTIGSYTKGTTFRKELKPTYLEIRVTDGNGNVTNWKYSGGAVTPVQ